MTDAEFYDECARHDWFYSYSDDSRVYGKGRADADRLKRLAQTNDRWLDIYSMWQEHMFSGEPFGTPKVQKPQRPTEIST